MCLLADIKHFYLNYILLDPEFMRIPFRIIPQEIIDAYSLTEPVNNHGCIYMCIEKGMYGLKQADIIANQELVKHMAPFGYHPVQHTPGLWVHDSIFKKISLVVDDFCVQYCSTENTDHFFKIPQRQIPHHIQHGRGVLPAPDGIFITIPTC